MTDNFFFPYKCMVFRDTDEYDENGDIVQVLIYSGCCDVQWGGSKTALMGGIDYQSKPTIIIDSQSTRFRISDIIKVQMEYKRNITCSIENFETIKDLDIGGTICWVKNMTDDE